MFDMTDQQTQDNSMAGNTTGPNNGAGGQQTATGQAIKPTVSHMLGELVWLLTQSPTHKHFALADLEWMIMPPLVLEQYRGFRGPRPGAGLQDPAGADAAQQPLGYALWALLSPEAEAKLMAGHTRLRPDEWRTGDRLWLIDLVAPFATPDNKHVERMMGDLIAALQPILATAHGHKLKFHRTDPKTGKRDVVELG